MTLEQINKLSKSECDMFMDVTCHTFDASQSLEEYTIAIRDYIYIWRNRKEGRKGECYTFDGINKTVKINAACIKQYYDERAPVDDAAIDVDFVCG